MATNTYVALQTQALGSAASSVTLSSISQAYTDLRLVMNVQTTDAGAVNDLKIYVNGDNSSGFYSSTRLYGDGSSAVSTRSTSQNAWNQNGVNAASSSTLGTMALDFMNYSNTTTYKSMLMRANPSVNYVMALVNLWRNTNAITSITIAPNGGGNLVSGSTFTLYAIQAA